MSRQTDISDQHLAIKFQANKPGKPDKVLITEHSFDKPDRIRTLIWGVYYTTAKNKDKSE
jgi:hypothetical protein